MTGASPSESSHLVLMQLNSTYHSLCVLTKHVNAMEIVENEMEICGERDGDLWRCSRQSALRSDMMQLTQVITGMKASP